MDLSRTQPVSTSRQLWNSFWAGMRKAESMPLIVVAIGLVVVAGGATILRPGRSSGPSEVATVAAATNAVTAEPRYTPDGAMLLPEDYLEWVFVGASTGLSYSEDARQRRPGRIGMFHNVYVTPSAYRHFVGTGEFPEQTMLALAMYEPSQKDDLVRGGFFEGEFTALEFAVKDTARFDGGWAYFDFGGQSGLRAEVQPITGACASCHQRHGAVDNVFVQFYPVLRAARQRFQ